MICFLDSQLNFSSNYSTLISEAFVNSRSIKEILEEVLPEKDFKIVNNLKEAKTHVQQLKVDDNKKIIIFPLKLWPKNNPKIFFNGLINSLSTFSLSCEGFEILVLKASDFLLNETPNLPLIQSLELFEISSSQDLIKISEQTFGLRNFNSLEIKDSIITKSSSEKQKLSNEFTFTHNLPDTLKKYYVQVLDFNINQEVASYTMKKINGLNCSSLFANESSFSLEENFFNFIEEYLQNSFLFAETKNDKDFYIRSLQDKNTERINTLSKHKNFNQLNDWSEYKCSLTLFDLVKELNGLIQSFNPSENFWKNGMFHGDLFFSNIVYCFETQKFLLIDPRGDNNFSFLGYELSKLSHSINGSYDYLAAGNFTFLSKQSAIVVEKPSYNKKLKNLFLSLLNTMEISVSSISIIESSLFLSMLPIHKDNSSRQIALLSRCLELFQDISEGKDALN